MAKKIAWHPCGMYVALPILASPLVASYQITPSEESMLQDNRKCSGSFSLDVLIPLIGFDE
jgi:hypothetical protein